MKMRKIISLVLALVLVCSIIPFAAFAEGEATSVTFDFSTQTKKNEEIASSNALSFFASCASDASYLTAATTKKIFNGNGSGGKWPNTAGFLKTGNSSTKGELSLTFTEKVAKVELVCHAWDTGKTDTIAVNGGTARTAPNAGSFDTMTFEITESETVQIVANKRTFIQSITVTFAGAEGGETPAPGEDEKPCEHTTVVDYVCADCGEVIAPAADSVLTLPQATTLGKAMEHNTYTEGKYYVTGVIKSVSNTQYGNMYIQDADGNELLIYGTYSADGSARYDAMDVKPVAGDTVKIYGIVGQYNGTAQIKNGWIVEHTPATTPEDPTPDVPEQPEEPKVEYAEIKDGTYLFVTDGKAMSNLVESKTYGYPLFTEVTVTDGVATGYTNTDLFTITNVEGGFTIQDSYGRYYYLTGTFNSFNVSAEVPAEGHIWQAVVTEGGVLILNVLKEKILAYSEQYSSFGIYADQSSVMTLVAATAIDEPVTPDEPETPEEVVVPETLAEQIAEAEKLANGAYLPYESTITGTIIDDPVASSRNEGQYKFTVSDGTNTILCYYTPVADGVVPVKGDTATVVGKLTAYNGAAQFDETAIAVVVNNTNDEPGTGDELPETAGISIVAMAALSILSGSALVLLKKKEF